MREALKQLFEINPQYKEWITNPSRIISFRNRLIHGYASISDEVVWGVIEKDLPLLKSEIKTLLERQK
ncbi:HepT-like ribonuclease domain-containing protein [Methanolacinia petrolearia]|uniref:HepT-like ribonuclease domain-containing protein n=1 Tax=Methanolacinia petrolearia TaxID=54120 RepID=UPI00373AE66A